MVAMAGASRRHDWIAGQLYLLIGQHLRGKKCRFHTAEMRVHVPAAGLYTYPDLSVVCEEPKYLDSHVDTLLNPALLVEILSPSTERYDRLFKVPSYRQIPSLRECLLVAQDQYHVQLYRRGTGDDWSVLEAVRREAVIELTSIGYTLRLEELYETAQLDSV